MKPTERKKIYLRDAKRHVNGTWKPKDGGWKYSDAPEWFYFFYEFRDGHELTQEEKVNCNSIALLFAIILVDDKPTQKYIKEELL